MLKKIFALIALSVIVVLGYGYWRVSTYGWLHVSLRDVSGSERGYTLIKDAEITLHDFNGNVLAKGKSDNKHGVVYLAHPEVGFCVEEESRAPFSKDDRQSWYDCYEKQATWVVEWARNAQFMDIAFDQCDLQKIPVSVSEFKDDWWLWWVPHPRIGGQPSTYFSINVQVDSANCSVEP